MRSKFFILFIGALFLIGCRPKGILSSKQMEDIFVDLHTAEGILQETGYSYGHDEAVRGYYLVILKQHGTTQAQFDSSLVWYTSNPTIFDKIYPKVIERLEAQLAEATLRLADVDESKRRTVKEWLDLCQNGYNKGSWEKKREKNAQKFVYVKKIL